MSGRGRLQRALNVGAGRGLAPRPVRSQHPAAHGDGCGQNWRRFGVGEAPMSSDESRRFTEGEVPSC